MKNIEDIYRLSPIQQRLLAQSLSDGPAEIHVEQIGWRMDGPLNFRALQEAWQQVVDRHPVLRTAFHWQDLEEPLQVVRQKVNATWEMVDWSNLSASEQEEQLSKWLKTDRQRHFDLSKCPLMRIMRIQLAEDSYQFIWTYHRLILDRSSAALVLGEVFLSYNSICQCKESLLPKSRPYRDYIEWLERQDSAATELYWRGALKEIDSSICLPAALTSESGREHDSSVARRLSVVIERLQAKGRKHRLNMDSLIHGAFALLLSWYSGKEDVVFGTRTSARPPMLADDESMAGVFADVLPLRVLIPPEASLGDWLKALESQLEERRNHSYVATEQVLEWCELPAAFGLVIDFREELPLAPKELRKRLGIHSVDCFYRLTESFKLETDAGEEWCLTVASEPNCDIDFNVSQIVENLGVLMEEMADNWDRRLSDLRLSITGERRPAPLGGQAIVADDRSTRADGRNRDERRNGRRVETDKLEAVLRQHPAVREAIVVTRDDVRSDESVVAYVILNGDRDLRQKQMEFSLFYFADADVGSSEDKYRIYIEGAKYADKHGFRAVWTPERHFHQNGGLYPNPSVLSAALATVTDKIKLRAGSVVLPLHHPLRVAEEWAVVDNLSKGRVGISFTSGWIPNDFAFFPERYKNKRDEMFRGIKKVQALWRGESIAARDGVGNETRVRIFPQPFQAELPIWLTCSGSPEMFEMAGKLGLNVLTALLTQSVDEVAPKLDLYRESLVRHGHDPASGHVTMMMHTFVGATTEYVLDKVRAPLCTYLKSHVGLIETAIKSLNVPKDQDIEKYMDYVIAFAFERYYRTASLLGTPEKCFKMIEKLEGIGVDEVASLIDFGVDTDSVLEGLGHLNKLKMLCEASFEKKTNMARSDHGALREYVKQNMPDCYIPTAFVLLDSLPLTANGQVDYQSLPAPQ